MIGILLALFMLQAGAPMGTVTGVVRSASGAPAAGVRVYAQQVRDATDVNGAAAPLEGLVQTDASGRYRLELAAGRYYIASGSVSSPTYYPGTTNFASAKSVTVTAGGVVEGIDFGSFVAASRSFVDSVLLAVPAGTLGGTVRFPDGTPAAKTRVVAFQASVPLPPTVVSAGSISPRPAETDAAGLFFFNAPPDSYYLVAGFAENSGFYTGGTTQPQRITLASGATVNSLDITVPFPSRKPGTIVSGTVLTKDSAPAAGAAVQIVSPRPASPVTGLVLPSVHAVPETTVQNDGTFMFSDVVPGFYNVRVSFANVNKFDTVDVTTTPVTGLRFSLPTTILSGRILMEDGSLVPDPELFASAVATLTSNPNIILSTLFPISARGTFEGLPDVGESRFYFNVVPEEYEIRSITAGAVDLMKEPLQYDGTKSVFVEARVARRTTSASSALAKVTGTVRDTAGNPSSATRVQLCCLTPNFLGALSAPVRPDGSFELRDVPPGRYTPALKVRAGQSGQIVSQATVHADGDTIKLELVSSAGTDTSTTIEIRQGR